MSTIRVLTLGWEFPPLVNGGLGIACLGLSKALAKKVDLRVIVPKADPSVLFDGFQLTGLNNVSYREVEQVDRKYSYDSFALVERAPIELDPYTTVEGESGVVQFTKEGRITFSKTHEADLQLFRNKEDLYAGDLALKVIQFSKIAVKVALQQDFDIIHAHDWMTYLAGVEVKKATGKPLVVHLHASQFDRAGADARGWIYDIEKFGMEQADAVIPVSKYTGTIASGHYAIDPHKIFPIHNGADPVKVFKGKKKFPEKTRTLPGPPDGSERSGILPSDCRQGSGTDGRRTLRHGRYGRKTPPVDRIRSLQGRGRQIPLHRLPEQGQSQ